MTHVLQRKVLFIVLIGSSVMSGSLCAIDTTPQRAASVAGVEGIRELILELIAVTAKKNGVNLTRKVNGWTVIDNEIVVDAVENGLKHAVVFTKADGKSGKRDFRVDAAAGLWGGFKALVRSLVVANASKIPGVKSLSDFAQKRTSKEVYYTGVVVAKGLTRLAVDSLIETAKVKAVGGKEEALCISFGITLLE